MRRAGLVCLPNMRQAAWLHQDSSGISLKYLGDDLPLAINLEKREKVVVAGTHNVVLHVDAED